MEVIKSKILGYCYGVEQSVLKAEMCIKKARTLGLPVYSIGQIIHNSDVVEELKQKGLITLEYGIGGEPEQEEEHLKKLKSGFALICAHGITDERRKTFEKAGFALTDTTCLNILNSQKAIRQACEQQKTIVIVGIKNHAESLCLLGTGKVEAKSKNEKRFFVSSFEEAQVLCNRLSRETDLCLVTQTTFPLEEYNRIAELFKKEFIKIEIVNRPCHACIIRQLATKELSEKCNAVIVVGGKNSENTKNLANIVTNKGKEVFLIENEKDIDSRLLEKIKKNEKVGICGGTSTPLTIVDKVVAKIVE